MEVCPKKMSFSIKNRAHLSRSSHRSVGSSKSTQFRSHPLQNTQSLISKKIHDPHSRAHSSKFNSLPTTCWYLFDLNTNIQLGFRQHYQRQVASLTKIMTTVIGLQLKKHLKLCQNLLIKVTEGAASQIGTTANLKENTWVYLKDLFYGIMLPSGNDAAHLLAEVLGFLIYYQKRDQLEQTFEQIKEIDLTNHNTTLYMNEFIKAMNNKAEDLELVHTRFSNPHGLQNAMNISTAKDILKLCVYASKNTNFRKVMNSEYHRCHTLNETQTTKEIKIWQNTNILLKEHWQGVKTGQTAAAGNCLASLREGIFIVILNCPDSMKRFTETKRIFDWYCEKRKIINSSYLEGANNFN